MQYTGGLWDEYELDGKYREVLEYHTHICFIHSVFGCHKPVGWRTDMKGKDKSCMAIALAAAVILLVIPLASATLAGSVDCDNDCMADPVCAQP